MFDAYKEKQLKEFNMARIIVSDVAQFGVKNATVAKSDKSKTYKKLVDEADARIKQNHLHDAYVYKNAFNCIVK